MASTLGKKERSQWQGASNGASSNGTCTCHVSQYRYIQTHSSGKKESSKSEDWDSMHISTTNSEGVGINIPDIPNGHLSLKWKNGLPDLEPFLHTENLMYPVLESPRYACHL